MSTDGEKNSPPPNRAKKGCHVNMLYLSALWLSTETQSAFWSFSCAEPFIFIQTKRKKKKNTILRCCVGVHKRLNGAFYSRFRGIFIAATKFTVRIDPPFCTALFGSV